MLTLALFPVYRCYSTISLPYSITIFNNIVQLHGNMCTKIPVKRRELPAGTSIHQRLTIAQPTWTFQDYLQHETPQILYTFLLLIICPWWIHNKNKKMFCVPLLSPCLLWNGCEMRVLYTYHSLKLEDRPLWLVGLCTTEAGDRVVLLWVSVVGDTRPGGVEDS